MYPTGAEGIVGSADSVTLQTPGLYEITYSLGYTDGATADSTASLYVGGQQIASTVRNLNNQTGATATYVINAVGGETVQFQLAEGTGLTGANLNLLIKQYSLGEEA